MYCDITSPNSTGELISGVMERYKWIDGLVNNAYRVLRTGVSGLKIFGMVRGRRM